MLWINKEQLISDRYAPVSVGVVKESFTTPDVALEAVATAFIRLLCSERYAPGGAERNKDPWHHWPLRLQPLSSSIESLPWVLHCYLCWFCSHTEEQICMFLRFVTDRYVPKARCIIKKMKTLCGEVFVFIAQSSWSYPMSFWLSFVCWKNYFVRRWNWFVDNESKQVLCYTEINGFKKKRKKKQ